MILAHPEMTDVVVDMINKSIKVFSPARQQQLRAFDARLELPCHDRKNNYMMETAFRINNERQMGQQEEIACMLH